MKIKHKLQEKLIKNLEDEGCDWTQEETRRILIEKSIKYFDEEIREKNWKENSKEWHKNV